MSEERRLEELAAAERAALDAWTVPPPPPDAAARALARHVAATEPRRKLPRLVLAAAAGVLVAAGAILLVGRGLGPARGGNLSARERTTLAIGARGVAVAEAGAELDFSVSASGAARVAQRAGSVFYRVERGGPFVVETRAGRATVLGTCFRVEVTEMRASRAGIAGAAAGAALATVVVVTVYEGRVLTATPRGSLTLAAGERGQLEQERAPRPLGEGEHAARGDRQAPRVPGAAAPLTGLSRAELEQRNRELALEGDRLRGELSVLKGKLEKERGTPNKTFDLSKEELEAMAKRCELRWDMPSLNAEVPTVPDHHRKELGLRQHELDAINRVLSAEHRQLTATLRKLYVEVTGDAKGADALAPESLKREIEEKSNREELKLVYQRLARERAGLQAPPADTSTATPIERMMRLVTSSGDRVERAIGGELGEDLARRYRELKGGFGHSYRSSYGCPSAP